MIHLGAELSKGSEIICVQLRFPLISIKIPRIPSFVLEKIYIPQTVSLKVLPSISYQLGLALIKTLDCPKHFFSLIIHVNSSQPTVFLFYNVFIRFQAFKVGSETICFKLAK